MATGDDRSSEDELWLKIDAFVQRFEEAWQNGDRPAIGDFLPKDGPEHLRQAVLVELVEVDMERRLRAGDPVRREDYVERYPELAVNRTLAFAAPPPKPVSGGPAIPKHIGGYPVEKILGHGSFGIVYLAHDRQLSRPVAIKVPHRELVSRPEDAEAYLAEARTVAGLKHANIVPVYHVGHSEEQPFFVVSMFIEGGTLARRINEKRPSVLEATELVSVVAETLHYSHRQGLVHRDIKPSNILLEVRSASHPPVPFVADFGLALRDKDFGKGEGMTGTPAYMSPEQARGEGHRVDGRSDIFSLGVVFYELLTGVRPFQADTQDGLLEQIRNVDVRPPRQRDDAIPRELERICLKALSRRASERYTTAKDFADDLRHFLAESSLERPPADAPPPPSADVRPIKIVPKGLRSFDNHDADFFLELLPGPRDREGLPDSIRFWKTKIEEMDPDRTFAVGLIYGPSGCGKSSLVKAGLLPRLHKDVTEVYVESVALETEARVLNGLRKQCPALAPGLGLTEALAALRRGQGLPAGKKVLIVLDQFEQWLHAKKEEENTDLVQALRQCDGRRVQCIVMVRDDFWLAVSRFLKELEVRLLEGHNSALVDLFDLDHAKRVLAAFGRAFGKLPEQAAELSREQKQFLEQAVTGLAREGKVICVRLALFAEMMKGKTWTPASLRAVGGTAGIGVTFLEETFSAVTAPPEHRYHQKAARGVLNALLPESGTDIKGSMRPYVELLEASGYRTASKDFDDLIRILDSEIRLITPTDPEGVERDEGRGTRDETCESVPHAPRSSPHASRYYQLTHDYLVRSLRDWLTKKQKETRRGRAELLLADRAGVWNARPENRQLPSLFHWLNIRLLTRQKSWTPAQRKLMDRAGRYHALRSLVFAALLALVAWGSYEGYGTAKAHAFRDQLLNADTKNVLDIVKDMAPYRRWIDPLLRDAYREADAGKDPRKQKLRASIALLPVEAHQKEYLYTRLLEATPQEVPVLRDALATHQNELREKLWDVVERPAKGKEEQRLRAATALAKYDPDNERWANVQEQVVNSLVAAPPVYLERELWMDAFWRVRPKLLDSLSAVYRDRDGKRQPSERLLATNILAEYAKDKPQLLADLLMDADEEQFPFLFPQLNEHGDLGLAFLQNEIDKQLDEVVGEGAKEKLAKRQANAAVAVLRMGRATEVWPLLKHSRDPRVRSYLIHRLGPLGADAREIIRRLDVELDVTIRRALILSLGEFKDSQLPSERPELIRELFAIYEYDHDAGMRGAAECLLGTWGQSEKIKAIDGRLRMSEEQVRKTYQIQGPQEQQSKLYKLAREAGELEKRLRAAEQELPQRQAAWERQLLERARGMPPSVNEGLIAHYPLDETTGTKITNAVNGQPGGSYQGAGNPQWVQGVVARALRLDGLGGIECGEVFTMDRTNAMSCGCWFCAAPGSDRGCLVGKYGGRRGFAIYVDPKAHLVSAEWTHESGSPKDTLVVLADLEEPAGRWHHLLVTYDGSSAAAGVRIYLDGRLAPMRVEADVLTKTILGTMVPLQIGMRGKDLLFRGEIDDVRLYSRCLSDQEVELLCQAGMESAARVPFKERTSELQTLLAEDYRARDEVSQQLGRELARVKALQRSTKLEGVRRWYVNGEGQTMVVIPGPDEFMMGGLSGETGRLPGKMQHKVRIGRTFAIGAKAVTVGEYRRHKEDPPGRKKIGPDYPTGQTSWHEAAVYCNWLNEKEGIDRDQWCYETTPQGQVTKLREKYLSLTGYRLPTEAEWEYACRAGAVTRRYYGESDELLVKYGWFVPNSQGHVGRVGRLKPNDLGLFDMHGNLWCWCQEYFHTYPQGEIGSAFEDKEYARRVIPQEDRLLCGACYTDLAADANSRWRHEPGTKTNIIGFRLARTIASE